MDRHFERQGIHFRWNTDKANHNQRQHGISFEDAVEVFFDPFLKVVDATREEDLAMRC